jgi:putative spermidine/putrescine transport system substrate-binding protein
MNVRRRRSGLVALLASATMAVSGCGGPGPAPQAAQSTPVPAAPSVTATATSPTASPTGAPASTPTPSSSPKVLGPGEGTVTVLAFRGYAEYGGSDPDVNWVAPFEKSTGCRVNLRLPQTNDQMDKAVAQTAYDVVSAPPEVAGRLVAEKKVVPLNTSLIPHYDEIPQWLRSQRSVTDGAQVYGVPYLWGSYVTLYDSTKARPANGGAIYSDRGPVMFKDSPLSIADAALTLKKQRPRLGIKDPFELTRPQLDAAMALLSKQRGAERSFWKDPLEALQGFAGESVRMGRALPYHLEILGGPGRPVKGLNDGPTTGWVDSWMVSAQAPAPDCAYRWLDWTSSAKAQQQAVAWNGLAPANPGACTWAPKKSDTTQKTRQQTQRAMRICDDYRVSDDAWIKKISFAVRPARDCEGHDGECTDYAEWATRWQQLVQ